MVLITVPMLHQLATIFTCANAIRSVQETYTLDTPRLFVWEFEQNMFKGEFIDLFTLLLVKHAFVP